MSLAVDRHGRQATGREQLLAVREVRRNLECRTPPHRSSTVVVPLETDFALVQAARFG
jgi:hypothetical protein